MITQELLDQYLAEQKRIKKELYDINLKIEQARLEIIKEKFGVKIGSIVKYNSNTYQITHIDTYLGGKPWLKGNRKLKDGRFGTGVFNLFSDWELA